MVTTGLGSAALLSGAEKHKRSGKLGVAATSYLSTWQKVDTLQFLSHCHDLGADGIQCPINGDPAAIRAQTEKWHMYFEAMIPMPKGSDTAEFEQALKRAQDAGAVALRSACLGTRRYETFKSLDQWKQFVADSTKSIEAARPILDKYKIPLGLENHKDWTTEEMVGLMQKYGGDYFGVCLDFGNNLSLCDPDPNATIEALAPFAVTTHMKDMAVEAAENGFLLAEVVLGEGYLDLPRAVSLVRRHHPGINLNLEMITRDPLKIPVLEDQYWITFPDRPGINLARTLRFVNQHQPFGALPELSRVPVAQRQPLEDQNVAACLQYARSTLGL